MRRFLASARDTHAHRAVGTGNYIQLWPVLVAPPQPASPTLCSDEETKLALLDFGLDVVR